MGAGGVVSGGRLSVGSTTGALLSTSGVGDGVAATSSVERGVALGGVGTGVSGAVDSAPPGVQPASVTRQAAQKAISFFNGKALPSKTRNLKDG